MPSVDFDLRQLEIFRKVVDLGSFSKAGHSVFLAQASVSERIASLESMVGTRLLDRLGRQVVPTRAGELLYKHAVLLLEMKRTACLEMQDFLGLKQGEIRIGGSTIPGEYILPRVIGHFRKKYPKVSVILTIADSKDIEHDVSEGTLELGVVGSRATEKSITSFELWEDELVLTVPKQHRWAKQEEIPIEELWEEPFILREVGSGTLAITEGYLRRAGLPGTEALNVVVRLGTSTAVKEGVKSGLGTSILSLRALETELKAGILRALRLKDLPMCRSFYLIRDKRRIASPLCLAMLEFLQDATRKP
jgi:DNA-binding transcriptional LysR family regulator